ncbi:TnsA-like heteromeric transposase endonuclease subunit [Streptomyces kasugaensis]|uniref:TnsA-like heteromeric transposase endonuclease subunit n=1 Tax=Streptomyces kasugaensis TaxID=1946 RepID=A0A4Q9I1M3_STRKA|nr:TnsA-like heteromeric transposase endonuclease subunit [Streptomyces kasugaensis]TBO61553.1 TnsA-like heteromeric transposase endonuclease subunit [Streptomyces kasugaensis]
MSVRRRGGEAVEDRSWDAVSADFLQSAVPWRTFRWYKGQRHYSGTYWSATMRDHVIYESRLELTRLLFADFDPAVRYIGAQPFLLKAELEGRACKHIPDYLLVTEQGPVVVDVKPFHRLSKPEVVFTFGWTRRVVEARGWQYEVWSEPPEVELENIRFLAGYRRDWMFSLELLDEIQGAGVDGVALGQAARSLPGRPESQVRSAIHHLIWLHRLVVPLDRPLSSSQILRWAT